MLRFYDEVTYYQRLEVFFDLKKDLHLVSLKNNLRSLKLKIKKHYEYLDLIKI